MGGINTKKVTLILALFLILGIVAISGCTGSNDQTSSNGTYSTNQTQDTSDDTQSNPEVEPFPEPQSQSDSASTAKYIGNANTHVFHSPNCKYVDQMSEDNMVSFRSRDEAISAGYSPCKVCSP